MRKISLIVIHCSAVTPNQKSSAAQITSNKERLPYGWRSLLLVIGLFHFSHFEGGQDQESQNLKPNEVLMNQSFRYPEVLS